MYKLYVNIMEKSEDTSVILDWFGLIKRIQSKRSFQISPLKIYGHLYGSIHFLPYCPTLLYCNFLFFLPDKSLDFCHIFDYFFTYLGSLLHFCEIFIFLAFHFCPVLVVSNCFQRFFPKLFLDQDNEKMLKDHICHLQKR